MFCVKMDQEEFRYSLYEIIGYVWDYQLELITNNEREELAKAIRISKLAWNGHAKRIEPVKYRVREGKSEEFTFWKLF